MKHRTYNDLEAELKATQMRLEEAEETLRAIQNNEVDALVIEGPQGQQVYTLQGAEQPYRTLMETMSEGALTIASDGTILYCNSHFSELIKTPLNSIMGESLYNLVKSANGQSLETMLHECGKAGCREEFFLKTAYGEEVPVSLSARSLVLADVEAFCIVAADLTEQKRTQATLEKTRDLLEERVAERTAELSQVNAVLQEEIMDRERAQEALRTSEERFRLALKNSPVSVAVQDRNFVYQWAYNQKTRRPDEIVGKTDADLFAPEDITEITEIKRRVLESGTEVHAQHWLTSNGRRLFLDAHYEPLKDSTGEINGIGIAVADLTEQRLAEEALRESEEKFRLLFENMAEGVALHEIVHDDTGKAVDYRILDVNSAYEQQIDIPRERAIGALAGELYGSGAPPYLTEYEEVVNSGEPLLFETYFPPMEKHFSISAIRTRPNHFATVFLDVTERKQAEEVLRDAHDSLELRVQERTAELSQAYDKLQHETNERKQLEDQLRQAQKMEALGTLAGGIAHDFNNLLGAVIGFTELIQDDLPPGNPGHRHAARVMEAGLRGRDLVKQMLTFSRKTGHEKKPLRLSSIVRESVKLLRSSIPTSISFNVNVMSESGVILADPVQIQQVLMNLCTNAYYAMRETGGSLDIELSDFSVGPSGGNAHDIEPGLYMKLTVRDTGIGIPAEIKDKIFDPFFTTKAVGEGTGLGLSVVLGIVKQSGGYITVDSEPAKGSTFNVYFPKVKEEIVTDATAPEEAYPNGSERVLFVDDEDALLEMGAQLLTRLGYKVTSENSSAAALALIEEDPSYFDLVITDQTMPGMTGVELAKRILALRPDLPVILCTGFSHLVDADSAKAAGIRGYVMKPVTKREIAKTVRNVLDERP